MKLSFSHQMTLFMLIFLAVGGYTISELETEDGRWLLLLVLVGGVISSIRAIYQKNKILKQQDALRKAMEDQL